ncbi:hypothetical protein FACS1894132_00380 [Clostridia bacterium]|nr:hypothetical protein FACS1894132_00380 [Clostridia bacterium]
MKIIGLLLLAACTVYTGFLIAKSFTARFEYLKRIHKMLLEIKNFIQFRELKIYEIIERLDFNLAFLKFSQHGDFLENWENSVNNDKNLYPKERELLLQFGRELGTTNTAGQIAILDFYINSFQTLISEFSECISKKTKSYKAMGIFTASVIFIIGI